MNILQNIRRKSQLKNFIILILHVLQKIEKIYHKLRPHSTELNNTEFIGAYSTFKGSPYSEGKLQYHLWKREPIDINKLVKDKSWCSLIERLRDMVLEIVY